MNNKENRPGRNASSANIRRALRQRAEEIALEKDDRSCENPEGMSPEEMRGKLHELLVHQIELEMQNDELRRAQAELEDERARYFDLYEMAPVGYCTISEKGLILQINLTAANLLGVDRSALIMKPISQFICKEDQDVYYLHKLKLFETCESQSFELRMTKKDGIVFWAHLTAITLQDKDGMRTSRVVLSDITERKLKYEELRAAQADIIRKNNILSVINQIFEKAISCKTIETLSKACQDIIETITESKISFIYEIKEDGLHYPITMSNTGWEKCRNGLNGSVLLNGKSLLTNDPSNHLDSIGMPEGDTHLTAFLGVPFFHEGKVAGMIAVGNRNGGYRLEDQEIVEALTPTILEVILRKRVEEALRESESRAYKLVRELEQADKNKNAFLNMLSHELRNPLATISAGIQLLDITNDKNKTDKAKNIMKNQMEHLCRLVDDLLDLTRISNNKIELIKEKMELNMVASMAIEPFEPLYDQKGIVLEADFRAERLYLDADPVRLAQIIGNLLHNALKFTQKDGKVIVSVYEENNHAVIRVADTGTGIQPDLLRELFVPFVQADTSLDRTTGGLGLGLSIVKGIAELHGGTVSAYSEGLGKGSSFYIYLPFFKTEGRKLENTQLDTKTNRSLKILVIEDNEQFAELLCAVLQIVGHQAEMALNGPDGIEKAKELSPDVLFCDIGLPGMDGFEVAKRIRNEASIQNVYMIALSGYANQQDAEKAYKSGFNKHLGKPVDIATIKWVLGQIC